MRPAIACSAIISGQRSSPDARPGEHWSFVGSIRWQRYHPKVVRSHGCDEVPDQLPAVDRRFCEASRTGPRDQAAQATRPWLRNRTARLLRVSA